MFLVIFLNSFFLNLKGYALLDLTLDSFGVEGILVKVTASLAGPL